MTKYKALVAVMGDLARSPRMQYHCLSLANNNYDVTVLASGHKGTDGKMDKSIDELENNKNIHQVHCDEYIDFKKYLPSILAYVIKPIWQSCLLLYLLAFYVPLTHVIIMQNPPSIPILPLLCIYSRIFRIKLIIDWHNYGYSILAINLHPQHLIVRVYKFIEFTFGRFADAGFCVSKAMRADLRDNYNFKYPIYVLYDKPPKHFKSLNLREKHNFFIKIQEQYPVFKPVDQGDLSGKELNESRFTMPDALNKNVIRWRPNRPAIIISSTSWTEDEDFDILYETLDKYNQCRTEQLADSISSSDYLPKLVCVITGKGPLKDFYQQKIGKARWDHVEVVMPWLSSHDYAKMVASCDLGICLHKSSSGFDLPMKVVDMFGCGVPVLAYKDEHFKAIDELVIEDFYGLTFGSTFECCEKLFHLLDDFRSQDNCSIDEVEDSPLARYKKNIKRRFLLSRWEDNWNREARPNIDKLIRG